MGAVMRRKKISLVLVSLISSLAKPLIGIAQAAGWRRPSSANGNIDLIDVAGIDDAFDDLWDRKRAEAERLLACRSSQSLRWLLEGTQEQKKTRLLVHSQERMGGYIVIMREDVTEIGLKRIRIADLFVTNNDPAVVNDLLGAAYEYTRDQGCHILEWVGMPAELREVAKKHSPFVRALETWPLYYKTENSILAASLKKPDAWYITPYDGDTTLV